MFTKHWNKTWFIQYSCLDQDASTAVITKPPPLNWSGFISFRKSPKKSTTLYMSNYMLIPWPWWTADWNTLSTIPPLIGINRYNHAVLTNRKLNPSASWFKQMRILTISINIVIWLEFKTPVTNFILNSK